MSVLGARPQFIKAAVVSAALKDAGVDEVMVHTGQHYDYEMSKLFFEQLGLADPAHNLEIGSISHGAQTGRILEEVEKVMLLEGPDIVIVYGDTNSTIGGALAAAKLHIPVAHVEAGLRSFNRRMPEEINRLVTDHLSDLLFVPTASAVGNLRREGIDDSKIIVTGDVMLDSVRKFEALYSRERAPMFGSLGIADRSYFVATVHRAENTDDADRLSAIVHAFDDIGRDSVPVIWPVHPRTRKRLEDLRLNAGNGLRMIDPIGYLQMQALLTGARCVLTDSGGLQKEAAFHGVPTITLRDETEWPETVAAGCNVLAGAVREKIVAAAMSCLGRVAPPAGFGDGNASGIIAKSIADWTSEGKAK
jgi:UDP-N-acetylglucosamine 2-epimerase